MFVFRKVRKLLRTCKFYVVHSCTVWISIEIFNSEIFVLFARAPPMLELEFQQILHDVGWLHFDLFSFVIYRHHRNRGEIQDHKDVYICLRINGSFKYFME